MALDIPQTSVAVRIDDALAFDEVLLVPATRRSCRP
jgi:hypothetical protein